MSNVNRGIAAINRNEAALWNNEITGAQHARWNRRIWRALHNMGVGQRVSLALWRA